MSQEGTRQCIFTEIFQWKGAFLAKNSYIVKMLLWQLKSAMKNKFSKKKVQVLIFRNQIILKQKKVEDPYLTEK